MFSFGPLPSSLPAQTFAPSNHALQSTSPPPRAAPSSASSSPLSLALAAQGGDDDSSMGLLSLPSFAARHSVLRRRSRAEKDDSSDDDDDEQDGAAAADEDSDDEGDDGGASSSYGRSPRFTAQHPHPQFKRVKLTSLLPLSFDTSPASPPLAAFPPPLATSASLGPAASGPWPARPTRSRSLGDCGTGRRSSASLDSSPPCSPTLLAAASPASVSSTSPSFASTFPSSAARRSPLKIIPPSSIARVRSVLPFSPRSHAHSQYLLPPTVNHSPRAALPLPADASSHPLENLFTRLTMQEPPWQGKEGREGKGERGFTHAVRQEEKTGRGEHRRSLSVVFSPAAAAAVGGPETASRAKEEVKSPLPSAPPSSWLVRVDSVDDMHDAMAFSASAAVDSAPSSAPGSSDSVSTTSGSSPPSVLTGNQMIHFYHQLRLHESDWTTLALAWRWRCGTGGLITRDEFVRGMQSMGCLTLEQLEAQVRRLRAELEQEDNSALYKEFFHFVFNAVRSAQPSNRRTIHVSTALGLLQSLLLQRYPQHMQPFTRFLSSLAATRPTTRITFDQWASLLDWCRQIDPAYLAYEEEGSWPVLMDEFIDWMRRNEPETMRKYEERRREREQDSAKQRAAAAAGQLAKQAEAAGDASGLSRSVVEEMSRMRVDGSSAGVAHDRDETFMPDAELSPQRRSSLRVRVPRLANIDAVSLDSDDHRHHQHSQLRQLDSAKLYLSRSLPSLPSLDARLSSSPLPSRSDRRLVAAAEGEMSFGSGQAADIARSITAATTDTASWDDTGMTD